MTVTEMSLTELRHHILTRQRALLRQIATRELKLAALHTDDLAPGEARWWARERKVAALRAEQEVLRRELHEIADRYTDAWWGYSRPQRRAS